MPVHHGAHWIEVNLRAIVSDLEVMDRPFEVLVVCDGDADRTSAQAALVADADDRVHVHSYEDNQGKGNAISVGIGHARGRLIGWLDADLDIHPSAIIAAVQQFDLAEIDAAIGSKRHPESRVDYPAIRRVYSWGYQVLVRGLFRLDVRDTQVGAKVFRREILDTVAPLLLVKRYAYDLEVLAVGAGFGFDRIVEVPVELDYRFTGTGISWRAVRNMLTDTLAIGYRIHVRHWYARQFAARHRSRAAVTASLQHQGGGT